MLLAELGANIDRIERMARYPVTAIEMHVSGTDPDRLRVTLAGDREEIAAGAGKPTVLDVRVNRDTAVPLIGTIVHYKGSLIPIESRVVGGDGFEPPTLSV